MRDGRARWIAVDGGVAVVLAVLIGYATLDPPGPAFDGPARLAVLLAGVAALPVAVRRVLPWPALTVTTVAASTATVLGSVAAGLVNLTYLPAAVALYSVTLRTRPVRSGVAALCCLVAATAAVGFFYLRVLPGLPGDPARSELSISPAEVVVTWVMLYAAWTSGVLVRWRRAAHARHARQLADTATAAERLRIARELHDITGHSLSLIAVKAGIANHLADSHPAEAREALRVIETTSRDAMRDVRHVLEGLRTGESASLEPPQGIAELPRLAAEVARAGVDVRLEVCGRPVPSAAMSRSAYRIVQEALTNVVRHAAPTRCYVHVDTDEPGVRIDVTDEGPPNRPPVRSREASAGYGLAGMRERVAVFGGTFTAAPTEAGGFRVTAELPYEGDPA